MDKNKQPRLLQTVLVSASIGLSLFGNHAWSAISGTVYRDLPVNGSSLNTYGVKDANELGVEGVTVTAYPGGMSTTTAVDGSWSLATTGDVRVEFSSIPSHLKESPDGGAGNESMRFVTNGSTVDFGVHNPTDFSDLNPDVVIPAQISGDPNGGGTAETQGTLVLHAYTANGVNAPTTLSGAPTIINFGDLGATYGAAWQRESKSYFTSAFAKRYVGFKSDPGSIFRVIDPAGGSPTVSEYFSLDALGFSTGTIAARSLPANFGQPAHDVDMFAQVGTVSLGDLELDATEENLFVVNLFDKKLYKVNIGNPAKSTIAASDVSSFAITDPGCTNGHWRPFGLGLDERRNIMMVGGVCDAAIGTTDDLHAYVYEFDLASESMGAASVLDFPLNFERLGVSTGYSGDAAGAFINTHWNPWSDAPEDWLLAVPPAAGNANRIHPEPALADIEVDTDGSLILGFRDMWGDRWGAINYAPDTSDTNFYHTMSNGDIYRAQRNDAGVFVFEDNGQFPSGLVSAGANNGDGPGGGEYYYEDAYASHSNVPKGGLAYLQGDSHFVAVSQNPRDIDSAGTKWISMVPGNSTQNYQIYKSTWQDGSFYKANGLGDVELLFNSAPIEIGNRVWLDANGNGVQDSGENGLSGVAVKLLDKSGTEIASATTDASGQYIFSSDPNGTSTASHIYQLSALKPDAVYTVQIPNVQGASKQGALGSNELTAANAGEGSSPHLNDSDGLLSNDDAIAIIVADSISVAGHNNHSYDFGFRDDSTCFINQPRINAYCDSKDTADASDDTFAFTMTTTSVRASASYQITDPSNAGLAPDPMTGLSYGVTSAEIGGPFAISAGGFQLLLTDEADSACSTTVDITPPATCSACITIMNTAEIISLNEIDNDSSDNRASTSFQANCNMPAPEGLSLVKTANTSQIASGDTVIYTLTLSNAGPGTATGVVITDLLPISQVTYVSDDGGSATSFVSANGMVVWNVDSIAADEVRTLNITVTAN